MNPICAAATSIVLALFCGVALADGVPLFGKVVAPAIAKVPKSEAKRIDAMRAERPGLQFVTLNHAALLANVLDVTVPGGPSLVFVKSPTEESVEASNDTGLRVIRYKAADGSTMAAYASQKAALIRAVSIRTQGHTYGVSDVDEEGSLHLFGEETRHAGPIDESPQTRGVFKAKPQPAAPGGPHSLEPIVLGKRGNSLHRLDERLLGTVEDRA